MEKSDEWRLMIKERGKFLRKTGQWADFHFLVGKDGTQVQFQCHKLLLSLASPVFETMFYGSMAEGSDPIKVPDIQPDAFKLLLDYIYTDEVNMTICLQVCKLWYAAKKYMLPLLINKCINYLSTNVKFENVCTIYEYADAYDDYGLTTKCLNIMRTQTNEVLSNKSFERSKLITVIILFSMDNLAINSELDLFDAAMRYHKAQQLRESDLRENLNVEMSVKEEQMAESVNKSSIRSVIEKIRFLTLTAEQFASEVVAKSDVLTDMESYAILMNILVTNTVIPLPTGFSSSRIRRKPGQFETFNFGRFNT